MSASVVNRVLVVNADDFGQTVGINNGILRAYREGILTSASLMVWAPAAENAVARAGALPIGLHIDLGEWAYRDGAWIARYERVALTDPRAVEEELRAQLAQFCRLTGSPPTHLDSHQHVHMDEPVRSAARRLANELSVPLRRCNPKIRYCGDFYGQSGEGKACPEAITVESLIQLINELSPGVTELACHPGEDQQLESMYCVERLQEVRVLCDPRVREAIAIRGIRLCSFPELNAL